MKKPCDPKPDSQQPAPPDLLLHTCCGPCATGCIPRLLAENRRITLFFSNSNLADAREYAIRLDNARTVAAYFGVNLIADPYRHDDWLEFVSRLPGYAQCPERGARCRLCFQYSLTRTFACANANKMNFATTLTVSPHKSSPMIFDICSRWANFEPYDFKKANGFAISIANSRMLNLYRQKFCGCEFSKSASGAQPLPGEI